MEHLLEDLRRRSSDEDSGVQAQTDQLHKDQRTLCAKGKSKKSS